MTEQEWLQCSDPELMWRYLEPLDCVATTRRKTKLLACGLVRLAWQLLDQQGRRITESMERYAEGCERLQDFQDVMEGYFEKVEENPDLYRYNVTGLWSARHENYLLRFAVFEGQAALAACKQTKEMFRSTHLSQICETIRDIFGNVFQPVVAEPRWRSPAAVELATAIYRDYAFERLPELADALSKNGCGDEAILGHCRGMQQSRHVRGCWVVDSVLGDGYWARGGRGTNRST